MRGFISQVDGTFNVTQKYQPGCIRCRRVMTPEEGSSRRVQYIRSVRLSSVQSFVFKITTEMLEYLGGEPPLSPCGALRKGPPLWLKYSVTVLGDLCSTSTHNPRLQGVRERAQAVPSYPQHVARRSNTVNRSLRPPSVKSY